MNYHFEERAAAWRPVIIWTILTFALSLLTSVFRIVARRVSRAGLWWDDWVMVVAFVSEQAWMD